MMMTAMMQERSRGCPDPVTQRIRSTCALTDAICCIYNKVYDDDDDDDNLSYDSDDQEDR